MNLALLFLSVFVAASYQHFERPRRMLWWPVNLPTRALNYYQPFVNYGDIEDIGPSFRYFQPERPIPYLQGAEDTSLLEQEYDENENFNVRPRINGYRPFQNSLSSKQQNGRFFFNSGLSNNNNVGNPLLKTVTFSLTSTCTALTFTTCIPQAGLVDGAAAKPCRRKKQIDQTDDDDYGTQFPVNPSKVRLVMPTEQPSTLPRNYRHTSADIASSKGEGVISDESDDFLEQAEKISRKKRLYYLWQSFATGTTITTWVVISSTYTATLNPTDNAGAAAKLPCLPPGFFICPAVGK